MSYKLQFKQEFSEFHRQEYLDLEREFISLELNNPEFPKGKRYLTMSGTDSTSTLIWECNFESIDKLYEKLHFMEQSEDHSRLFDLQKCYIIRITTSIYRSFS